MGGRTAVPKGSLAAFSLFWWNTFSGSLGREEPSLGVTGVLCMFSAPEVSWPDLAHHQERRVTFPVPKPKTKAKKIMEVEKTCKITKSSQ